MVIFARFLLNFSKFFKLAPNLPPNFNYYILFLTQKFVIFFILYIKNLPDVRKILFIFFVWTVRKKERRGGEPAPLSPRSVPFFIFRTCIKAYRLQL